MEVIVQTLWELEICTHGDEGFQYTPQFNIVQLLQKARLKLLYRKSRPW